MQDNELVALCRGGQTNVYASLVERYQGPIFGLALQFLHSGAEAEEVAQESFLRVYQQIIKGKTFSFFPYLKRVTVNLCFDRLRQRGREREYITTLCKDEAVMGNTPEDSVLQQDEKYSLQQALASLPKMYQEVLLLFYAAELSQKEIAARLEVPLSIVKNRIFRAKRLLKEAHQKGKGEL